MLAPHPYHVFIFSVIYCVTFRGAWWFERSPFLCSGPHPMYKLSSLNQLQISAALLGISQVTTSIKEILPTIWRFPEIGVPLNHQFLFGILRYKPSSYWGSPWYPPFIFISIYGKPKKKYLSIFKLVLGPRTPLARNVHLSLGGASPGGFESQSDCLHRISGRDHHRRQTRRRRGAANRATGHAKRSRCFFWRTRWNRMGFAMFCLNMGMIQLQFLGNFMGKMTIIPYILQPTIRP